MFDHVPLDDVKRVEESFGPLPQDYKEFVQEFGRAKMFLELRTPMHLLEVISPPTVWKSAPDGSRNDKAEIFIILGYYVNSGYAGLRWFSGEYLGNSGIFSASAILSPKRKSADTFEQWLKRAFARCRKEAYSNTEWEAILKPVRPFSSQELRILEAIPLFEFRKVGVSPEGNLLVEVKNNAPIELSYLSVGVRLSPSRIGGCALPTLGIAPGESQIVEHPIYKGAADPNQIELFRLPLPDPEDRPYYLEFRHQK